MARPVIGITTYLTRAVWDAWEADAALVPASYVRAVVAAGGAPLLVPPGAQVDETLAAVDGLVFSGGSDLDPATYGAPAHAETSGVVRERDDFELELMRAALERDVPLLAICRGSQVLNVARGGGIEQHLPDVVGHPGHRETPGVFGEHDVEVLEGTRLASIVGAGSGVKSHNHRATASWATASSRLRARTTARSRRSRTRHAGSRSGCCGIPRRARTSRCSRRS